MKKRTKYFFVFHSRKEKPKRIERNESDLEVKEIQEKNEH